MRILLLHPPLMRTESRSGLLAMSDDDNTRVSVGLYSLAAVLRERGHEVKLCNHAVMPWSQSLDEAEVFSPDLVGITCMTFQRMWVEAWISDIKKRIRGVKVVLGGPHASCLYAQILERWPGVDFVAVGEAEQSLCDLVRHLESRKDVKNVKGIAGRNSDGSLNWPGPAKPIEDLGALPVPSRYYSYDIVTTSRGCPYSCTFCCSKALWGCRVRERPVGHIITELEYMRRRQRSLVTFFKDETFTLRRSRVREVCQAMVDAGLDMEWFCDTRVDCIDEERLFWLRKAGCTQVSFGIETGSPAMLEKIDKRTTLDQVRNATKLARNFGLCVRYYLMSGLPGERPEDLERTLKLIRECRPSYVVLTPLILLPGTPIFDEYCKEHDTDASLWFESDSPILHYDPKKRWLESDAGERLRKLSCLEKDRVEGKFVPPTEEELLASLSYPGLEDHFSSLYAMAQHLRQARRYEEALSYYERTLEVKPDHGRAHVYAGLCCEELDDLEQAMRHWAKVEANEHEVPIVLLQARIYRGRAAWRLGNHDTAFTLWKSAHRLQPGTEEPLRLIAEHAASVNQWDLAEWSARSWAELQPRKADPHHIAALACFNQGNRKDAGVFFAHAHFLEPNNRTLVANYGRYLTSIGDREKAEEIISKTKEALLC